jgi:hypothetical protein
MTLINIFEGILGTFTVSISGTNSFTESYNTSCYVALILLSQIYVFLRIINIFTALTPY